jgi:hypothetical protein
MKYAVKTLLTILGAVGLCSCESLPFSDPFDRGGYIPSRNQAIYDTYNRRLSELGADAGNIEKMNAFYSSNW